MSEIDLEEARNSEDFLAAHFDEMSMFKDAWYDKFPEYGDESEDFLQNLKHAVEDFDNTLSNFIREKFGYTP